MEINKEQEALAKKKFEEDIKNVDSDDVNYASKREKLLLMIQPIMPS